jgi:hypothetical protein
MEAHLHGAERQIKPLSNYGVLEILDVTKRDQFPVAFGQVL